MSIFRLPHARSLVSFSVFFHLDDVGRVDRPVILEDASNSQDSKSGSDSSGSEEEETDNDVKDSDRRRQEASTPISFSLDDVSSSDDQEEGDEGDALDGDHLDDHGEDGAWRGSIEERSSSGDEAEPADERQSKDHHQSNVFAGLQGDGVGARAVQLDSQHGRGTKGGGRPQGELKRAREALRYFDLAWLHIVSCNFIVSYNFIVLYFIYRICPLYQKWARDKRGAQNLDHGDT